MTELEALVALTSCPHLGSIKIRLLIQHFGSALDVFCANPIEFKGLPGFGQKFIDAWTSWRKTAIWQENLDLVSRFNATLISYTDPNYPRRLLEISDFPVVLYMIGTLLPKDGQCLAVVGTRNPTIYGKEMAEKMGADLVDYGYTVVSGLARGVDAAAHEGALKRKGRTIAVIGSGLANIYPPENRTLANYITKQGCVISEFPMNTPPDRQNFPQRNRIVSGMTLGTVLIEAPHASGAMITMQKAKMQGRPLFAIPGRADVDSFRGNHLLIKEGSAQLIENGNDVASYFETLFPRPILGKVEKVGIPLEAEEQDLLFRLPTTEVSVDEIVVLTKLPIQKISVLLMSLVLKKALKELPGKIYKKGS